MIDIEVSTKLSMHTRYSIAFALGSLRTLRIMVIQIGWSHNVPVDGVFRSTVLFRSFLSQFC